MPDPSPPKRRFINLGEFIALAALVVSGLGLWLAWKDSERQGPTEIVEQERSIPLVLRGKVEDDGRRLVLSPVESGHALDSARLSFAGGGTIDVGSDGNFSARDVEGALADTGERKGQGSARVSVDARYVEAGDEKTSKKNYVIRYRWKDGGLFSDDKLRLTGFSRS